MKGLFLIRGYLNGVEATIVFRFENNFLWYFFNYMYIILNEFLMFLTNKKILKIYINRKEKQTY